MIHLRLQMNRVSATSLGPIRGIGAVRWAAKEGGRRVEVDPTGRTTKPGLLIGDRPPVSRLLRRPKRPLPAAVGDVVNAAALSIISTAPAPDAAAAARALTPDQHRGPGSEGLVEALRVVERDPGLGFMALGVGLETNVLVLERTPQPVRPAASSTRRSGSGEPRSAGPTRPPSPARELPPGDLRLQRRVDPPSRLLRHRSLGSPNGAADLHLELGAGLEPT